ncbi:hypothetical protein EV193_106212 [Herbihabitans rhizosphaerae]|uniref:WXG100 family type VII secretion target n=1 Tax=Herbihabitans rhizosphaerae TaxID=1872711 RepID=A0A4Q7KL63_9PSEU|nr:hypothetical protein EV193_106212 [Herbihabitans rhizosphaerae]
MPLNTFVDGDPEGARGLAAWLNTMRDSTHEAATVTNSASAASTDGWTGKAAEGFRDVIGRVRPKMDDLSVNYGGPRKRCSTTAPIWIPSSRG